MFEFVHTHRRWLMILMGLVSLTFVLSGVYSFSGLLSRSDNAVAKIDGDSIQMADLDKAHRERVGRMLQRLGGKVDPGVFDTPQMRAATLDGMLTDRAMSLEAARLRLAAPEAVIYEQISAVPAFQVDGKFDLPTYRRLLAANGLNEAAFEAHVREDLGRQTLAQGVAAGAMMPRTVSDRLLALDNERRQTRRLVFKADDYLARANVSDDAVKSDYEANKERYRTPESVKADYLLFSAEELSRAATVTEAALREFYDKNPARWSGVDQRRASHILITAGKDGSAPDKAAAKTMAQALLAQLRAKPGEFARLAREKSKDPGSAAQGGDLGWFGRGAMTKAFEDAVFALKKEGQLSDVVETEFGFHIIELTGIRGTQPKPFEQVRAAIEAELRKQAGQKAYNELADQFTNFVYEQADDLKAAAAKFNLPLHTIERLTRQGAGREGAEMFTPAVIDAVFSADSLEKHHNTKAIDVGGNAMISVHVTEHTPSAVPPLDALKAAIRGRLEHAAALQLARQASAARLAELQRAADDKGFEAPRELARHDTQVLPPAAINAVMTVPAAQLPAYVGIELADGTPAIVHILGSSSVAADSAAREQLQRSWTQRIAGAEESEYVQGVRERLGAKITRAELSAAAPR